MLQAKQAEETKILREQMQAEAKAQRDQMDNMMKASMKQAEEDRRAFMQENQALNERLVQMQKSNEGMQQMVESLKQQLQQNQNRQHEVKKPGFFDRALQVIPALAGVAAALPSVVLSVISSNQVAWLPIQHIITHPGQFSAGFVTKNLTLLGI
ncbi:hypothetical protein ACROYT_G016649 [Oculina patagonica]